MAESTPPSASLNWNPRIQEDAVQHFYLTDFVLTTLTGELQSILLPTSSNDSTQYILRGNLRSPHNRNIREPYSVLVSTYYIDVGIGLDTEDVNQGFWMTGHDADLRFKLEYPAAPEYADYATGILHLALERRLYRNYQFPYDSGTCFHMTNFILTDQALGMPQTLILPRTGKKVFVLTGRVQLNVTDMQEDEQIELSAFGNYDQLYIRTYVTTKYLVDFGRVTEPKEPQIWLQDNHHSWIKLVGSCHREYKLDYDTAMRQTINNVAGYNWKAEDEQIWRHVTNFKLTDEAGVLHPLEITRLDGVFNLWGDLCAPPNSTCPTIPIKVCVKLFSIDMGRTTNDPHQGIWMRGMQTIESWYKLEAPAVPEYRPFADPLFHKTAKYLDFYDALVFQDCSVDLNYTRDYQDADGNDRYYCVWPVEKIYKVADPKFDLQWVKNNGDFILNYLDLDLEKSSVLVDSLLPQRIEDDHRRATAPPAPTKQLDSAAIQRTASAVAVASSSALSADSTEGTRNVEKETKTTSAEAKKLEKAAEKDKIKEQTAKEKKRALDTSAEEMARETAAAKARKVASVLNATTSSASASTTTAAASSSSSTASSSSSAAAVTAAPPAAKPIKKKQSVEMDSADSPEKVAAALRAPLYERADDNGKPSLNAEFVAAKGNTTVVPRSNASSSAAALPQPTVSPQRTVVPTPASAVHHTSYGAYPASSRSLADPPDRHSLDRASEAVGQKRDRSGSYDAFDNSRDPIKHRAAAASFDGNSRDRNLERDVDRGRSPAREESLERWNGSRDRWDHQSSTTHSFGSREGERWKDSHNASERSAGRPSGDHRVDAFGRDIRERGEDRSGTSYPANNDPSQTTFLCRYCRTLAKLYKCKISRHIDGQCMPDEHSAIVGRPPDSRAAGTSTNMGTACRYCRTMRKLPTCNNSRHVDGKLLPLDNSSYGAHASSPREASVANSMSANHVGSRSGASSSDIFPAESSSFSAPRSAQSSTAPASPPRGNAAIAAGTGLSLALPQGDLSAVRPQFSPVGASSPPGGDDEKESSKLSERVMKRNEMDVERSSYQKRHQFHTQEQSASQGMLAASVESAEYLQRLQAVNSKPNAAKWGVGLKLPPSSKPPHAAPSASSNAGGADSTAQQAPTVVEVARTQTAVEAVRAPTGVEVVRLGARETNPKRRLAMMNMNSSGVYTAVVSTAVGSGDISPRGAVAGGSDVLALPVVAPFDRTLKPVKSNLRDSTKPKKGGISWCDMRETGGELRTVHIFEKVAHMEECPASNNGAGPTEGSNENGVYNTAP